MIGEYIYTYSYTSSWCCISCLLWSALRTSSPASSFFCLPKLRIRWGPSWPQSSLRGLAFPARRNLQAPHMFQNFRSKVAGNARLRSAPKTTQGPCDPAAWARRAPGPWAPQILGAPRGTFRSRKVACGVFLQVLTAGKKRLRGYPAGPL